MASSAILPFVEGLQTQTHEQSDAPRSGNHAAARAFTLYAPEYDQEQQSNPLARWTRQRSLQVLSRTFRQGDRVLEIGCGTGEEALYLASRGVEVVATDAAEGMIQVVRAKLAMLSEEGKGGASVTPRVLAGRDIGRLIDEFGSSAFAGAYSSFGSLNCEPDLRPVVSGLAELVEPGGKVVIGLLNRFCAWETLWHLAKLEPRIAFRRWGGQARATVRSSWGTQKIPVYYWTPGRVEHLFRPYFSTVRRAALTWALPPPYLKGLAQDRPGLFRLLARLEVRTATRWPFYFLGDHLLLEMERGQDLPGSSLHP